MPHNFFYLRKWVTAEFYKHHIVMVYDDDDWPKKRAELVFQGRDVDVSTLLCLSVRQSSALITEIQARQPEYQAEPHRLFTTHTGYLHYQRGGDGAAAKRTRLQGLARLKYGVRYEDGRYKIHHLDRMTETLEA